MKKLMAETRSGLTVSNRRVRLGSILVLSAAMLIMIFAFVAFTVDVGFITVTKGQLQNAADASAHSASIELREGFSPYNPLSVTEVEANARAEAVTMAGNHGAGERQSVYANSDRDVRLGQYQYNPATNSWEKLWGVAPYNMVEVTLRRDQGFTEGGEVNTGGDSPLPLFFAPVIGHENASLSVRAVAAMKPGVGFRVIPGSGQLPGVLPITLDELTWHNLIEHAIGDDDWSWNEETNTLSAGSDGVLEVNLYPSGDVSLPPGNRGTVDIGSSNNSTSDIERQILNGLNEYDLSFFGGELRYDNVPLILNGDTGLSAGIKDELQAIKGLPRVIPIFSQVHSPGNNATYTIVKFVGIRIMDVKLTGNPNQKRVIIQPAPYMDSTVIPGDIVVEIDSILAPAQIIE